jgi:hypothetical protein
MEAESGRLSSRSLFFNAKLQDEEESTTAKQPKASFHTPGEAERLNRDMLREELLANSQKLEHDDTLISDFSTERVCNNHDYRRQVSNPKNIVSTNTSLVPGESESASKYKSDLVSNSTGGNLPVESPRTETHL